MILHRIKFSPHRLVSSSAVVGSLIKFGDEGTRKENVYARKKEEGMNERNMYSNGERKVARETHRCLECLLF